MLGKQAKILSSADVADLLVYASCMRNSLRNRVIVLLSTKAGLRAGDVVTSFDGKRVADAASISGLVNDHKPGDKVELVVRRGGTEKTLTVTLGERPASP